MVRGVRKSFFTFGEGPRETKKHRRREKEVMQNGSRGENREENREEGVSKMVSV